MKSLSITIIFFSLALLFKYSTAQTYNPAPQTWMVDAETATCSTSKAECLLVKQAGKKEFEIFDESIEGFNYEKGNKYTIVVRQELKQPPIGVGESIFKYVLVKIVSKKPENNTSSLVYNSGTSNSTQKIFEVNFETVPCESDNTKSCLLVKQKGKSEFEILNATISGFNYQPGYAYTIAVKETNDGNYYLVNELNKRFVKNITALYTPPTTSNISNSTVGKIIQPTTIQISSSLDKKWYLRKMKEAEGSSIVTDDNMMWIEINTFRDRLDGYGSCNKFASMIKSDLNSSFIISKLTSNFSICGNKKVEDLFYDLLQQANRFEIKNGNLILSNQWNFLLGFTANPNNKEDISITYTPASIVKSEDKTYATNTAKNEDKYVPPVVVSTTSESSTSTSSSTTTKEEPGIDDLQKQIEQLELLKKQKEEKEKLVENERIKQEVLKQQKIEQDKLAKQKEIEALKKQLEEKQSELDQSGSSSTYVPKSIPESNNTKPKTTSSQYKYAGQTSNYSEDCKPDYSAIDKITKVQNEIWIEKIAATSSMSNTELVYYIFIGKSENTFYLNLQLSNTIPLNKEKEPALSVTSIRKGDKFTFEFSNSNPLVFISTDFKVNRKVSEDAESVSNSYTLSYKIEESEIPNIESILTTKYIDGIRLTLLGNTNWEKEINSVNSESLKRKFKCFFNSLK